MARNAYYNFGKELKRMFPEQTKTNLHIVIWLIVFLVDLMAVFFLLKTFGFPWFLTSSSLSQYLNLIILFGSTLVIFWLETFIYNKIHSLFR